MGGRQIFIFNAKTWPYMFRQYKAQYLAENGATASEIQSWFGWAGLQTAQNYVVQSSVLAHNIADKIHTKRLKKQTDSVPKEQ
jgi:site-specific recombinase XerD